MTWRPISATPTQPTGAGAHCACGRSSTRWAALFSRSAGGSGGFAVVNRSEPRFLGEAGLLPLPWAIADGPDMRLVAERRPDGLRSRIVCRTAPAASPIRPTATTGLPTGSPAVTVTPPTAARLSGRGRYRG